MMVRRQDLRKNKLDLSRPQAEKSSSYPAPTAILLPLRCGGETMRGAIFAMPVVRIRQ